MREAADPIADAIDPAFLFFELVRPLVMGTIEETGGVVVGPGA